MDLNDAGCADETYYAEERKLAACGEDEDEDDRAGEQSDAEDDGSKYGESEDEDVELAELEEEEDDLEVFQFQANTDEAAVMKGERATARRRKRGGILQTFVSCSIFFDRSIPFLLTD
jgi:hypothetical protein